MDDFAIPSFGLPSAKQRPEYADWLETLCSAPSREAYRQALRAGALANRYVLARLLGYEDERNPWDPLHYWIVEKRLPQLARIPGAQVLWLMPRGTYKTAIIHQVGTVYDVLRDPDIRTLMGSWKFDVALKITRKIKEHLETPILLWLFPDRLWVRPERDAPKWTESIFTVNRSTVSSDGTVTAFSVEAMPTGLHGDKVRVDDIVEATSVETEDGIEKTRRRAADLRSLRANPDSQIEATGTIWHPNTVYQDWMVDPNWIVERHPAIVEDPAIYKDAAPHPLGCPPGSLAFPRCKPLAMLEKDKAGMPLPHFQGQYLLRMEMAEGAVWTPEQIRNYCSLDDMPLNWSAYHLVDLATDSDDKHHCESVVTTGVVWPDGRRAIVQGRASERMAPGEIVDELFARVERWGGTCVIEEIGAFQWLEHSIIVAERRLQRLLPRTLIKVRPESKHSRIWRLDQHYRAGTLLTLDPDQQEPDQRLFFQKYEHDALLWPDVKRKDILDTIADLVQYGHPPAATAADPRATLRRTPKPAKKQPLIVR